MEAILAVFETVVKTLEGDEYIRRSKQGWTGFFGNIWDVVLSYKLLLTFLIQSTSVSESTLLRISWMNIIRGWTRRLSTIRLWHSI